VVTSFCYSIYLNCAFVSCIGKFCFQVIAERLSEEEIGGLKELFNMIDTDKSGTITFEELKEGLKRVGSELMESEIKTLMDAVSKLS
jgi:calcium-dependent protein kinase